VGIIVGQPLFNGAVMIKAVNNVMHRYLLMPE
jgi:hypothetical protein